MKENKRAYQQINAARGISPKLYGTAKRTAKQPVKNYIETEKIREANIYSKLTSGLIGKKGTSFENKKSKSGTNITGVNISKKSSTSDIGKENKSRSGSTTIQIPKEETKSKSETIRFTEKKGFNPKTIYSRSNPESNPSEEFYGFRPGKPPVTPKYSKQNSNSLLGLLAGGTGILSTRSSISQQYGQLNNSIQGVNLKSGQSSKQSSILDNMTKIGTNSGQRQSPKQSNLFKQSNDLTSKSDQTFKSSFKQSSKQDSTQIQSFIFNMPSPQKPTVSQTIKSNFVYVPRQTTTTKPPKKIIIPPLFGPFGKKGKGKNKSGPTGLINLNVNNVFSSSLSINVGNNRVEF